MKTIEQIIASNIKERRKRLKMSQTALAEESHLSLQTINRFERGKQSPRNVNLKSIAKALGCTKEDLYKDNNIDTQWTSMSQQKMVELIMSLQKEIDEIKSSAFYQAFEKAEPELKETILALLEPEETPEEERLARVKSKPS